MNLDNVKLTNWSIEEIDEHLIFKYNDKMRVLISPDGIIHTSNDLILFSAKTDRISNDQLPMVNSINDNESGSFLKNC